MKPMKQTIIILWSIAQLIHADTRTVDLCIYGGTPGAIAAAVQAKRMDKSVVVVSPDRFLGGMTSGGLGFTDIGPYQIDYGTIIPKKSECDNLFATFAVSASHIAFGSIRMEPVFMVLSQSAATAAAIAIDRGIAVQDVPYGVLKTHLLANGQRLDL